MKTLVDTAVTELQITIRTCNRQRLIFKL